MEAIQNTPRMYKVSVQMPMSPLLNTEATNSKYGHCSGYQATKKYSRWQQSNSKLHSESTGVDLCQGRRGHWKMGPWHTRLNLSVAKPGICHIIINALLMNLYHGLFRVLSLHNYQSMDSTSIQCWWSTSCMNLSLVSGRQYWPTSSGSYTPPKKRTEFRSLTKGEPFYIRLTHILNIS